MTLFSKIVTLCKARMAWAAPYEWFHILCLVLSVAVGVWLCRRFPAPQDETVRRVVWCTAMLCLVLEVYKQVTYSFHVEGDVVRFRYAWYVFPFQFCSTPMYVGLLAGITRGRVCACLMSYLATYATLAGVLVMAYPVDVLTDVIGVNVQTMVCHGSMISIGIFLLCSGYVKTTFAEFKKAIPVFLTVFLLAVGMNEAAYRLGVPEYGEFNMFYISPYGQPTLPVLSWIQAAFPTPVPQLAYLVLFSAMAYGLLWAFRGINAVTARLKQGKNKEKFFQKRT